MHHMSPSPRLTITFGREQFAWLANEAEKRGVTLAWLVRRIIDEHIKREQP